MESNSVPDVPPKISPETVAKRQDDLFVLDVRNEEDYAEWSIDGSHNVPVYDELLAEEFSGLADATDELPTDEEVAVVCVAGITSTRAAQFLRDRGYEARTVTGGMEGWGSVHRQFDVDGTTGITQLLRPGTGCASYLIHDRGEAVVVDPASTSTSTSIWRRIETPKSSVPSTRTPTRTTSAARRSSPTGSTFRTTSTRPTAAI